MNNLNMNLLGVADGGSQRAIALALRGVYDRMSSQTLSSPGLTFTAAAAVARTGASACQAVASGVLRSIAATTNMAALVGTVTNATLNVYCFFIDSAGTLTSAMGTAAGALAGVKLPAIPQGKAMLGFVIINPTGTGDFVGGTTALDNATVVPNAVFVNTLGAFDPTALI